MDKCFFKPFLRLTWLFGSVNKSWSILSAKKLSATVAFMFKLRSWCCPAGVTVALAFVSAAAAVRTVMYCCALAQSLVKLLKRSCPALCFLFLQAVYHNVKPGSLQQQLEAVHLDSDKAEIFSQIWATAGPELVEKLKHNIFSPKKVHDTLMFNIEICLAYLQKTIAHVKAPHMPLFKKRLLIRIRPVICSCWEK